MPVLHHHHHLIAPLGQRIQVQVQGGLVAIIDESLVDIAQLPIPSLGGGVGYGAFIENLANQMANKEHKN